MTGFKLALHQLLTFWLLVLLHVMPLFPLSSLQHKLPDEYGTGQAGAACVGLLYSETS